MGRNRRSSLHHSRDKLARVSLTSRHTNANNTLKIISSDNSVFGHPQPPPKPRRRFQLQPLGHPPRSPSSAIAPAGLRQSTKPCRCRPPLGLTFHPSARNTMGCMHVGPSNRHVGRHPNDMKSIQIPCSRAVAHPNCALVKEHASPVGRCPSPFAIGAHRPPAYPAMRSV